MKYSALNEKEVMQKLVRGILNRAATDALKSKVQQEKLDSEYFIKSEYCELMCYVARKEYSMLLRVANIKSQELQEELKEVKTKSRLSEK